MKVGDYVRAKDDLGIQLICKINKIIDEYCIDTDKGYWDTEHIIKSSPNIIDLIEREDYVNGCCVLKEHYTYMGEHFIELDTFNSWEWGIGNMPTKYIKSILTKEQFEAMEYKVGE